MAKLLNARKCLHQVAGFLRKFTGLTILSGVIVVIFLRSYYKYRYSPKYYYLYVMLGDSLCWSRGSASVLCVSCCLVLLPMCRNVLVLVRNSNKVIGRKFGRLLDMNVWFHKTCAGVIVISAGIHILAHFVNAKGFSANYSVNFTDLNFASYHNQEPLELFFTSVAGLTGILMTLLLVAMIVTSTTAVRRASYEMFWYTHHLFIVFFLLLFVHGLGGVIKHQINLDTHPPGCKTQRNKTSAENASHVTWCSEDPVFMADKPEAWMWCIVPLFIYIMERLIRAVRSFQKVEIIQAVQHDDDVVEVKIRKNKFTAASGQYIFIRCADVSRFEWHPFTLTQCPSSTEDSTFSIHFKIFGDWTAKFANRLLQMTSVEEQEPLTCVIQDGKHYSYVRPSVTIAVDGPYGSPCMDIWRYHVSVCIATGIGVTPFASIINELRQRVKSGRRLQLRRLYFVWLWGRNRPDFLICNFYVTGSYFKEQVHTKQYSRWLTSRLHRNRPSWKDVFGRVSEENPRTEVGIFYCGSRQVTSVLKKTCRRFYPTRTRFIFHEEVLT